MTAAGWLIGGAVVATGLGLAPGPDTGAEVSALVAGLSAPRKADRDRAAARLEAIGEPARPALVVAAGSTDLELRARAAGLLDAIEGQALARPTPVALDFRDRPVSEVVDALADGAGLGLILDVQADPRRAGQKVTLVAPGPLPFWEAIERLGKAAGLRPDLSANAGWNRNLAMRNGGMMGNMGLNRPGLPVVPAPGSPSRTLTGREVVLVPDLGAAGPPTIRSGRFLIVLAALQLRRDRTLGAAGGRPPREIASDRFEIRARIVPEPNLTVGAVGEAESVEAEDDRGRPIPVVTTAPAPGSFYDGGGRGMAATIRLRYPDESARSIKRLRGVFRVTVVGTRPDPVVAPLETNLGTPSRSGDISLTVHSVKPAPDGAKGRIIEVTLSRPEAASGHVYNPGMNFNRPASQPPPSAQGWFEFVDGQGRTVERVAVINHVVGDGQRRMIRVNPPVGVGPAVSVRYLAPTWATLAVPFEFRDLPIP